jgi:hypothetical protein
MNDFDPIGGITLYLSEISILFVLRVCEQLHARS